MLNDLVKEKKLSIEKPDFNCFVGGYYWGLDVKFVLDEKTYRWQVTIENSNETDKIDEFYPKTKEYSKNTLQWDDSIKDSSDLISKISQFSFT